jgi:NAD(P)-dependent dehydrogenase (short-subunit alcohol dehydrogenase family)
MDPTELFRLDGQVAVVTGASGGIGSVFASGLAAYGASVVLLGRQADRLRESADAIRGSGGSAAWLVADLRSESAATESIAFAYDEFGRADILVNNAGMSYAARATKDTSARFADLLDVNLVAAFRMCQAFAVPLIDAGLPGSIVNVSSVLGLSASVVPTAAYTASKAGLLGLTRDLATQWTRRYQIRVNALAPGFIRTEMITGMDEGHLDELAERTLVGALGRPEELLGPLLLLASAAGSYLTGTTLAVDGGWSLH